MFYGCENVDITLAAPSGVCVETVGAAGVAAWDRSVMVPIRELAVRLDRVEKTLGARYCWEALSAGGQCAKDWALILKRVDAWISQCEEYFSRHCIPCSALQLVWGDSDEFLELHAKIYDWQNWGD
jgi:hypothetical protein